MEDIQYSYPTAILGHEKENLDKGLSMPRNKMCTGWKEDVTKHANGRWRRCFFEGTESPKWSTVTVTAFFSQSHGLNSLQSISWEDCSTLTERGINLQMLCYLWWTQLETIYGLLKQLVNTMLGEMSIAYSGRRKTLSVLPAWPSVTSSFIGKL